MIGIIKWTIMNKTLKGNILFHSDIVPNLWWQQVVFFHCSWDIVSKSVIQKQLTLLTFLSCPFVEVLFFSWRDLVLLTQLFTFLCGCSLKDWHRQKGERAIVDGWKILHDLNVFQTTEKMGKDNPQHGPRIDRYTVKPYNKKLSQSCQTLANFLPGRVHLRNFSRAQTLKAHF